MKFGAQFASVLFSVCVFALVFEMVRRRRFQERYAILWLTAALALVVLAAWAGLLKAISDLLGIATPSNAFFVIAFAFTLFLLLHLSAIVSRFADQTHVLAQRLALLEQRVRAQEARAVGEAETEAGEAGRPEEAETTIQASGRGG